MIALQILKIVGIVLGCIVGLILLILLLVLVAPFRYKFTGKGKNEDVQIAAAVRWLLGLVTVRAEYAQKQISYYLRIFGIKVFKGTFDIGNEEEMIESLENRISGVREPRQPVEYSKEDYPGKKAFEKQQKNKEKDAARAERAAAKAARKEEKAQEKKPFLEKISELWQKIQKIYEKMKQAKYIISAPVTKRAFRYAKAQLFKMLGSMRPRSMKGEVCFGLEDPARTAEIYGVTSSLASMIDRRLMIVPDMDEPQLSMDVAITGRIFAGYVVLCVLKIIINRDVRRVIRYTKKNLMD